MENAYAIGVTATLHDDVSPHLMRMVDWSGKANASLLELSETLRSMFGAAGSFARSMDKAATAATALGDSSAGLTRASYLLDTMAASSGDLARNMAAARAEGRGMGGGGMIPGNGGGGNGGSGGGSAGAASSGRASTAAGVAAAGILVGVAENARLQHTNLIASATEQLPMADWLSNSDALRELEFKYARQYAVATHGKIEPFGEAMVGSAQLLRTLPADDQKKMVDTAMPFAAYEATFKHVPLPDAFRSFVELAHQAGAYTPQAANALFEAMAQASLTTHASLGQIGKAASYALPSLHSAGANSSDVMLLIATLMQAGVTNTKAGTWLNAMASNSLPNTLGSGLFSNKKQNEALHDLGLYKGNKSQFYQNGSFDLMKEIAILAEDRQKMEPLQFNAALKMAFGTQGQRFAALFSEPAVVSNLHALSDLTKNAQSPVDILGALNRASTIAQADQTIASANMALMNGSLALMGPVNVTLGAANSVFKWTADVAKDHPVLGAGLVAGELFTAAMAGMGTWKLGKGAASMVGNVVKNLTKNLASSAGTLIGRAFMAATAEEIGAAGLVAIGGIATIGALVIGGIGYMIAQSVTSIKNPSSSPMTDPATQLSGEVPIVAPWHTPSAQQQAPVIHNHFYVDSHEITTKLIPPKSLGPTGFNPSATPFTPSMGMY